MVPDSTRNDLPIIFKELGYKVGVEVGVFKGRFTAQLGSTNLKVYGVDPWVAYEDFNDERIGMDKMQEKQDFFCKVAQWRLQYHKNCKIIKKTSMEAVKDFEDNSIDFVYIDGNHYFKYIAEDLWEWSKKVRKGGIVSGHDYLERYTWYCHVRPVVDAYIESFNIRNWYVFGNLDKHPSWMWFKE